MELRKEFISGQAEPFLGRAGKANGNCITARQPQWPFYQSRWPFYQVLSTMAALSRSRTRPVAAVAVLSIRSGQMARFARFGLRMADFILPCKRSFQAEQFLSRAGKATSRFMKAGQPQWPFYQRPSRAIFERAGEASGHFIRPASRSGRFIKAGQPQSQC